MKQDLESVFDIPFCVYSGKQEYIIWPDNEMKEYFEIRIYSRSGVRIIIEAYPQNHAADMLMDMAAASEEKKALFLGYRDIFIKKGCHVNIKINNIDSDLTEWPAHWKNFHIRITKITDPELSFEEMATEWAILAAGMMLSLLNVVPVEPEVTGYSDGQEKQILSNRYERNRLNRELCLQANGYTCRICGFNFERKYGMIGKRFIHVHHIDQLSISGGAHVIDPVHDLIPVCPNCHAMLHTQIPPLLPEQLVKIIKENDN